jgi:hypothetical protein
MTAKRERRRSLVLRLRGVVMGFAFSEKNKERVAESEGGKGKAAASCRTPKHLLTGKRNVVGSPFLLLTV